MAMFFVGGKMDQNKVVRVARAGVGVMIYRDGKVLLGLRNDDPEKADSQLHGEGTWTFPGGKVDFGNTLELAAKREVKEETDIDVNSLKIFSITDEIVHDAHFVTVGFLCEDFEGEVKVMEPDEIVEWKWFSLDELPNKIFKPTEKMILNFKDKEIYKN
jgi:8-oxo-dGTP diphosphatase